MNTPPFNFEKLTQCPYCGSGDIAILYSAPDRYSNFPGEFYLSKCGACGLGFQNPRVPECEIHNYYVDTLGYYQADVTVQLKPRSGFFQVFRDATLANRFGYPLSRQNWFSKIATLPIRRMFKILGYPDYIKDGRLLEIGCSSGKNLAKLQNLGWQVEGVEFHGPSAERAKQRLGVEVKVGRVEDVEFADKRYDAVVLQMALEHLYSPFATLEKITSAFRSGGQLIFSIPCFDGFEFKFFKRHFYSLHLPGHIFFFNKKILREYLAKLGYEDIRFYHHFFDRDVVASAYYKYKETGNRFWKIVGTNRLLRLLVIKPLVFLLSLFNATSRVTVYAKLK